MRVKKKSGYGSASSLLPESTPTLNVNPVSRPLPATSPYVWQPPPPDSAYNDQVANIDTQAANAKAGYAGQAKNLISDYGFQQDPNDQFKFVAVVDPNNPFSRAALLQKSFQTAKAGYGNSYAARGLGSSGAANAAQQFASNQYQQGYDSLTKGLTSGLGQLSTANQNVDSEAQAKKLDAYGSWLSRRPEAPMPAPGFDPFAPGISSFKPGGSAPALKASDTPRTGTSRSLGRKKRR